MRSITIPFICLQKTWHSVDWVPHGRGIIPWEGNLFHLSPCKKTWHSVDWVPHGRSIILPEGNYCHGMTSLFPFLSLSVPHPISITFRLHPTSSACLLPPPLQLQGVLMQLCYVCTQTSLRLTSDPLGPDPHTKGYCLYTSYNLSDPFFIINNG